MRITAMVQSISRAIKFEIYKAFRKAIESKIILPPKSIRKN